MSHQDGRLVLDRDTPLPEEGELPEIAHALEREALGREPRGRRADSRRVKGCGHRVDREPERVGRTTTAGASFMASASASVSSGP